MAGILDRLNTELESFGRRAQKAIDEGRLQLDRFRLQRERDDAARKLGYLFHRRERGQSVDPLELDAWLQRIDGLDLVARAEAARTGGLRSAQVRKERYGSAVPFRASNSEAKSEATPKSPKPSSSSSSLSETERGETLSLGPNPKTPMVLRQAFQAAWERVHKAKYRWGAKDGKAMAELWAYAGDVDSALSIIRRYFEDKGFYFNVKHPSGFFGQ